MTPSATCSVVNEDRSSLARPLSVFAFQRRGGTWTCVYSVFP